MKWLLSIIGVSPYAILTFIAVATGLFFFGRYEGGHAQRLEDAIDVAKADDIIKERLEKSEQITYTISTATDMKLQEIQMFTVTQAAKVTEYVSPKSDAACAVPVGLVQLLNAAASGMPVPDAGSESYDAPSGVALHSVGGITAANYGACRQTIERLKGLQKWVTEQQALAPK